MKVVIASYTFLPDIGGVSTNVSILAQAFVDAGHDVTLATLTRSGPVEGYGYTVIRRPKATMLFKLYRQADLLILSNLALQLIYPLLLFRRPFALRHHSESAFHLTGPAWSPDAIKRSVRARVRHFVTSHYIGRTSGLADYTVTSPFADPHHITPDLIAPPADRNGALFVGRVEEEKGIGFLLDRWPVIREALGVEELRIVGDGSIAEAVRGRIAAELPDVTYVGRLDRAATAREMGKAAYVIVPSLWAEPFGAVALEAVAAGAMVIVADRGGLAEAAGDVGFLFDPDDQGSLMDALAAARDRRERTLASPAAWEEYLGDVSQHTAKFLPSSVVDRIIKTMAPLVHDRVDK